MENGKKIFSLALLICMMWLSCVKDPQDIPGGFSNNPAFSLSGIFDGQPLNIDAGVGGWTMQPVVTEEDSTVVYTSLFSLNACLDQCKPLWEFRFYRAHPATGDEESIFMQTVKAGLKDLVLSHQQRDSFAITLTTHPGLFMSGYSYWENVDGPVTFQTEYKDVVGYGEFLNVCFQSLAFTGCQYIQCIYFDPSTLVACRASIQPKIENDSTISLMVRAEGTPPFRIEWFNGTTSSSIVLPLQDSTSEIYAGVTVTDALGNRSELSQTIRLQNGIVDACYFPITLTSIAILNLSASYLSDKVEIIYTDADGVEWSTTSGIQPPDSYMNIGNVEYFDISPMNESAYKIDLTMSVELFNSTTGESRRLLSQETSIALSHK